MEILSKIPTGWPSWVILVLLILRPLYGAVATVLVARFTPPTIAKIALPLLFPPRRELPSLRAKKKAPPLPKK
jgi:hypothetical protein